MKRFGLPMLLSAGYASLLFLVFSSDFSKENSFLLKETDAPPKAMVLEQPDARWEDGFTGRIASLNAQPVKLAVSPAANHAGAEQSPESAGNAQP